MKTDTSSIFRYQVCECVIAVASLSAATWMWSVIIQDISMKISLLFMETHKYMIIARGCGDKARREILEPTEKGFMH